MQKWSKRLGLIAAMLMASTAVAQTRSDLPVEGRPELIDRLFACRSVSDEEGRLKCYDEQVAAIERAESEREIVLADRAQLKEARRGLFGFSLPRIKLFSNDNAEEEVKSIEAKIVSVTRNASGKLSVTLDSGARWVQTDSTPVLGEVREGDTIKIDQAALGSYMGKIGQRRAIRMRRLN